MRCATRSTRSCGGWNEHAGPPQVLMLPLGGTARSAKGARMSTFLSIKDLRVAFRLGKEAGVMQRFEAVKGVSFDVPENTTVALVGESGSGKSVTAMSILNLLPDNAERSGAITFQGRDLLALQRDDLQR